MGAALTASGAIAVVPFGARPPDPASGLVARQLARRIVERAEGLDTGLVLRPVFLVSVPEQADAAGYVIIGSTPDAELAAGYAASLDCDAALVGTLRTDGDPRLLDLVLVDAREKRIVAERSVPIPAGALGDVEAAALAWLAEARGLPAIDLGPAAAATEEAYRRLLEGMDAELNATLLASGSPAAAGSARLEALDRYAAAAEADRDCAAAEERLLVLAAESLGGGLEDRHEAALARLAEARPRSWRAQYLLGELRLAIGDAAGAVVALEHADALRPLEPRARLRLARTYLATATPGPAASHLRRVGRALARDDDPALRLELSEALIRSGEAAAARGELERAIVASPPGPVAAKARRLRLRVDRPDLERDLEAAGADVLAAPPEALDGVAAAFERVRAADPAVWEAAFGLGLVARRRGDPAAAIPRLREALALFPDQPDALHELGLAQLETGDATEAARTLDRASEQRSDDPGYLADAGYAMLRAGRLADARDRLDRALALDPDDRSARAYRAELDRIAGAIGGPPVG